MFSAFAKFDNYEAAQKACDAVLGGTNGIVRIGTRRFVPPHAWGDHNQNTAESIAPTVLPSSGTHHGQWDQSIGTAVDAARQEAEYDRKTGLEPPRDTDYILCAEGGKEAVEHAAKIMRSMGGSSVDVRESRGSFLDGQPPIK